MRNGSMNKNEIESLSDALGTLEQVARNSSTQLGKAIKKDYKNLRKSIENASPEFKKAMMEAKEEGREWWEESKEWIDDSTDKAVKWGKESWDEVDETVKSHRWEFLGGTLLLGAIIGYLLGRK